jgi:hypothetical protein
MLRLHPGVAIRVSIDRKADIWRNRQRGVPEEIVVGDWSPTAESKLMFSNEVGRDCAAYLSLPPAYYLETMMGDDSFPPTHLADFLGTPELLRVPSVFQAYVQAVKRP